MTTQRVEHGWVPELTFGARLALVRQHYGWNVKEAAGMCKLPVETWRGWERDGRSPTRYLEVCKMIAKATGADYDWLLDGRRFPPPRSASTPEYTDRSRSNNLTLRNELATASLDETRAA
jgi:transcriptional regulator with XRE-family HTH domain